MLTYIINLSSKVSKLFIFSYNVLLLLLTMEDNVSNGEKASETVIYIYGFETQTLKN